MTNPSDPFSLPPTSDVQGSTADKTIRELQEKLAIAVDEASEARRQRDMWRHEWTNLSVAVRKDAETERSGAAGDAERIGQLTQQVEELKKQLHREHAETDFFRRIVEKFVGMR